MNEIFWNLVSNFSFQTLQPQYKNKDKQSSADIGHVFHTLFLREGQLSRLRSGDKRSDKCITTEKKKAVFSTR